ncbi:MAG: hypothetical protein A2Y64_08490 [Candidatus Coatesbacteria bacterium RBG_13_66_14]|uniref:Uncharacterized protein n=1 Tax=Candidatus Coatesbacteria bacterium RBG_13_66_14 TaxID=1817816 RepID=A0A1F5FHZ7_9BACT|nr:MAG: hypothetical protein A2Y64_08490 [Candidatus Coatesbacteria bacterium RBG_13_66_14]
MAKTLKIFKRKAKEPPKDKPFFPDFAMFELLVGLILVVLLVVAALIWPGVAGPAADPSGEGRPESFIFHSLGVLPGWLVAVGIGLAVGFVILLFFIPRLDPGDRRTVKAKRVTAVLGGLFILGWLGLYAAYGFFAVPQGSNNTPGAEWGLCYRCHGYWDGPRNPLGVAAHGAVPDANCMTCHLDHPKLVNYYWHAEERVSPEGETTPAGLFPGTHRCSDCHNPHAPKADAVTPGDTRMEMMRAGGDRYVFPYRRTPSAEVHPSLPMSTCYRCHEFGFQRGGASEVLAEYPDMGLVGEHPPLGGRDCLVCHEAVTETGVGGINCLFTNADGDVHGLYGVQGSDCTACHSVTTPGE